MLVLKLMSSEPSPDFSDGKGFVLIQLRDDDVVRFYRDELSRGMVEIRRDNAALKSYALQGHAYVLQGVEVIASFAPGAVG